MYLGTPGDLDEVSYPGRGILARMLLGVGYFEEYRVVYLVDKGGVGDFLG